MKSIALILALAAIAGAAAQSPRRADDTLIFQTQMAGRRASTWKQAR